MPKCPNCGIVVNTDFCPNCGTVFQTTNSTTKTNKIVCPQCGTENDTRFCSECGTDLDVYRNTLIKTKCPKCGKEADSKYCPDCGTRIESIPVATPINSPEKLSEINTNENENDPEPSIDITTSDINKSITKKRRIVLIFGCITVLLIILIGTFLNGWNPFKWTPNHIGDIKFEIPDNCNYVDIADDIKHGESLSFMFWSENDFGSLKIFRFDSEYEDMKNFFYDDYDVSEFLVLNNEALLFKKDDELAYQEGVFFSYNNTAYSITASSFVDTNIDEDFKNVASKTVDNVIESIEKIN